MWYLPFSTVHDTELSASGGAQRCSRCCLIELLWESEEGMVACLNCKVLNKDGWFHCQVLTNLDIKNKLGFQASESNPQTWRGFSLVLSLGHHCSECYITHTTSDISSSSVFATLVFHTFLFCITATFILLLSWTHWYQG